MSELEFDSDSEFDSAEADTEVDEEEEEEKKKKTAYIIWSEHTEGFENHETEYEIADRVTKVKKYLDGKDIHCIPNFSTMTEETQQVFKEVQGKEFTLDEKYKKGAEISVQTCVEALNKAMRDEVSHFALTRPPGHHARGCCKTKEEEEEEEEELFNGFCHANNALITACYAIKHHECKNVCILDFDLHHGGGATYILENRKELNNIGGTITYISLYHQGAEFDAPQDYYTAAENDHWVFMIKTQSEQNEKIPMSELCAKVDRLIPHDNDLLILSAGFDHMVGDRMMDIAYELTGLWKLQDYKILFDQIAKWTSQSNKNVSVGLLEGGYTISNLQVCVENYYHIVIKKQKIPLPRKGRRKEKQKEVGYIEPDYEYIGKDYDIKKAKKSGEYLYILKDKDKYIYNHELGSKRIYSVLNKQPTSRYHNIAFFSESRYDWCTECVAIKPAYFRDKTSSCNINDRRFYLCFKKIQNDFIDKEIKSAIASINIVFEMYRERIRKYRNDANNVLTLMVCVKKLTKGDKIQKQLNLKTYKIQGQNELGNHLEKYLFKNIKSGVEEHNIPELTGNTAFGWSEYTSDYTHRSVEQRISEPENVSMVTKWSRVVHKEFVKPKYNKLTYFRKTCTLSPILSQKIYFVTHLILAASLWGNVKLPDTIAWGTIKDILETWLRKLIISKDEKRRTPKKREIKNREVVTELACCLLILKSNGLNIDIELMREEYKYLMQDKSSERRFIPKHNQSKLLDEYHTSYLVLLFFILLMRHPDCYCNPCV